MSNTEMAEYEFIAPWKPGWAQDYKKYGVDWLADWICFLEVEYKAMQDHVLWLTDRLDIVEKQLTKLTEDVIIS